jgi:WD40 repeat protein
VGDVPSPSVFLSHSGADTVGARELKRRLVNAPDARAAGLKVWFDKDDLRPGEGWQPQIEQAIAKEATAFVVYVGSRGVMNWVDVEVRVALSRAVKDKNFLFIPVLAAKSEGASALPPFARLYQGVRDPLAKGEELGKLLKAVLQAKWDSSVKFIDEPFVGLRSMREEEADRFFGRDAEVKELVEKFRELRLVAIVADSGTGKSSLAEAGFAPAFRGGAPMDPSRSEPDDRVWHVVAMRPGANPEEGLRTGVSEAAEKLGRSGNERASLRRRIAVSDPSETAFALQCDLPARKTATLLIVDQFEELLTQTPDALCAPFVRLLLALAGGDKDIRVLLTVRADYFNLVSDIKDAAGEPVTGTDGKTLFERLIADGRAAVLPLKRISEAGLSDAVRKPLGLAGNKDEATLEALLKAVRRDISDQPSDLPLMQVALRAAWREHQAAQLDLNAAYDSVGGVLGALAKEAETARKKLSDADQGRLESIFVRLVRLGDTGGATRRTAALDEFDAPRRALLRRLGRDEFGRLVVVGEKNAEIAHEALITQWPWLQGRLKEHARDVRRLDRLIDKAQEWNEASEDRKDAYLATGAERESFDELTRQRADWLSPLDCDFAEASNRAYETEREKERRILRIARHNESVALTALANMDAEKRPVNAAKLALAAWPRDRDDAMRPQLAETLDVVSRIVPRLRELHVLRGHTDLVSSAAFSRDGTRAVTASADGTARVWDAASGHELTAVRGQEGGVPSAAFSPDGTRVVTVFKDRSARVWDAASGHELAALKGHEDKVNSATFSPDGTRVVTASDDKTARFWDAASGRQLAALKGHEGWVFSAAFSRDGTRVVTASNDNTARVWDAASGRELAILKGHETAVRSAVFSGDGTRVVTASSDRTARVWDASSGRELATLKGHERAVQSAAFSGDGTRVVTTSSDDRTARVWDSSSGRELAALRGHEKSVWSAAFGGDATRIVTGSSDNTARVWDAASGRQLAALRGHRGRVLSAAVSPDGARVVTASEDRTARIWDVSTIPRGNILQVACALLRMHEDPVSLDGATDYPLTFDRPICVTDPPPPDLLGELPEPEKAVK